MVYFIRRTTWLGARRNYHEPSVFFYTPKNFLFKYSSPPPPPPPQKKKKKLAQFSYPKKSQNQKVQTPKNPLIIPVASNLVYPLPPNGVEAPLFHIYRNWAKITIFMCEQSPFQNSFSLFVPAQELPGIIL